MIICHQHHLHLRINQDHLTFFFFNDYAGNDNERYIRRKNN